MLVVSDTTPIISLMKANKIEILKDLFNEIIIPEAVFDELTTNPNYPEEASIIRKSGFIKIKKIKDRKVIDIFQRATGLDLGESEAILYSDENNADLLMMEEIKGRQVAKQMNIRVIGTLGIFQLAYEKGLMSGDDVRDCINNLKTKDIYISDKLVEMVLSNIKD